MSLGALQNEADLKRWLEQQLAIPGVLPPSTEPQRETGTGSATFTASADSAVVTVAHHLGVAPSHVSVEFLGGEGTTMISHRIAERTESAFKVQFNAETALSATIEFTWEARS